MRTLNRINSKFIDPGTRHSRVLTDGLLLLELLERQKWAEKIKYETQRQKKTRQIFHAKQVES